jgi:hypothetical protein
MTERYRPPSRINNGGKRPGAGRKVGVPNKAAQLATRQAMLTGELPHMAMLRWLQTGVADVVATEPYIKMVPKEGKKGVRKNKQTGEFEIVYEAKVLDRPIRDDQGHLVKRLEPLDVMMLLETARASARFFAAQVVAVATKEMAQSEYEHIYRQAGQRFLELMRTPLTLENLRPLKAVN